MAKDLRFFQLNTGAKIPSVGLGTWQADPGVVGQAIDIAVKVNIFIKKICIICYKLWDHSF